uniref:Pol-polyprotein n=1 Tax=Silene latifolia TaxID=37657 RepID=Q3I6J4_SILLA|nr:pol-polyprotein [Silene latifolia]
MGVIQVVTGGDENRGSTNGHKRHLNELYQAINFVPTTAIPASTVPDITIGRKDYEGVVAPHSDPLVVHLDISNHLVKRCLIDTGAYTNIMFRECFLNLGLKIEDLSPCTNPLYSFSGAGLVPLGSIRLPVMFGQTDAAKNVLSEFVVIDGSSAYNVLIGRVTLSEADAVMSIRALTLMYVSDQGEVQKLVSKDERDEVVNVQISARGCNMQSLKVAKKSEKGKSPSLRQEGDPMSTNNVSMVEGAETEQVEIDPGRTVTVGVGLEPKFRADLLDLLRKNKDVFAYSAAEMPGVSREVIVHKLNVLSNARPVKQKMRNSSAEKDDAIKAEVDKLLEAGFIMPCTYPEWLANVVMVKKSSGGWRMCVDFTNLNKACPKDCYPLPRIDSLIDATASYTMLSLLDAFSGYHQVFMAEEDVLKCAFITIHGTYMYKMMSFGLKNAGATYTRLVDKVFQDQKGRNIEAYVDDAIVKSKSDSEHLADLSETFCSLRKYKMKLNPMKCNFGVRAGKFLGVLVSARGIDANPEKVQAILDLLEPRNRKEVMMLTGRMAALARFISRSTDKSTPFFKVLKGNKDFSWGEEQSTAFRQLKAHLITLPTLSRPMLGETLYLYIAVTSATVSAVIIREEDKQQHPIYFISHTLLAAETNYPLIEKAAFAVVVAARKLKPYFNAHPVTVLTDQPLEKALENFEKSGRLIKWAVELSGFGIQYKPRPSIKGQALADFLAECTYQEEPNPGVWEVYTDGSSTTNSSGAGILIISPNGDEFEYALKFTFSASNNESEYEAVITGVELARAAGAEHIVLKTDSLLVTNQIRGEYEARDDGMVRYLERVKADTAKLKSFQIQCIPRSENNRADTLSKLTSSTIKNVSRTVLVDIRNAKSITETVGMVGDIEAETTWMTPIMKYKLTKGLPEDRSLSQKIKRIAARYLVFEGELYRRSVIRPLLKCVGPADAGLILTEIHDGICGHHMGARTLADKALRAGYFWPTMLEDSRAKTKKCKNCQMHAPVIHAPSRDLQPVLSPLPFAQWGMDLLGPFPTASGGRKYLIVAVDYFTKWVEAVAVPAKTTAAVRKVIWENIITRFGLPQVMVFDHGREFWSDMVMNWLEELGIKFAYSSVCHPQSNGQAEAANKTILNGLKKKVEDLKGRWADELPGVLWSLRTTEKEATGYSPFHLVYGSEAVLPIEAVVPTFRTATFNPVENEEGLKASLDLVEESRDTARLNLAVYQNRMRRAYNHRVHKRDLRVGDLVLRKSTATNKGNIHGKMTTNWEGPYKVVEEMRPGTYRLTDMEGVPLMSHWNTDNLRKYFI